MCTWLLPVIVDFFVLIAVNVIAVVVVIVSSAVVGVPLIR